MRIVVREGFSADLGDLFMTHLSETIAHLEAHGGQAKHGEPHGFSHT